MATREATRNRRDEEAQLRRERRSAEMADRVRVIYRECLGPRRIRRLFTCEERAVGQLLPVLEGRMLRGVPTTCPVESALREEIAAERERPANIAKANLATVIAAWINDGPGDGATERATVLARELANAPDKRGKLGALLAGLAAAATAIATEIEHYEGDGYSRGRRADAAEINDSQESEDRT